MAGNMIPFGLIKFQLSQLSRFQELPTRLTSYGVAVQDEVLIFEECVGCVRDVHHSGLTGRLHLVGQADVVRPHVELETALAHDPTQHGASMNPNL